MHAVLFASATGVIYLHIACHRIEPAINAVLSREPDAALTVESRGIEIGIRHALDGQRPYLDRLCRGIDPHNGILAAVGEPGGAIRPHDDTVRSGFLAE